MMSGADRRQRAQGSRQRGNSPMLYWAPHSGLSHYPQDLRMHRGNPSLDELRRIVRRYPLTWLAA